MSATLTVDQAVPLALAEWQAWYSKAVPSDTSTKPLVVVRCAELTAAPLRRHKGHWVVRRSGVGYLTQPRVEDDMLVFSVSYAGPPA